VPCPGRARQQAEHCHGSRIAVQIYTIGCKRLAAIYLDPIKIAGRLLQVIDSSQKLRLSIHLCNGFITPF
jgi:hypothetical protein